MAGKRPKLVTGMAGLLYPITQVSLVVEDMDPLLEAYYRTFGWAPWQDFDHVPPVHHDAEYKGRHVDYSLRGAEVYVGSLNFELLRPLPAGESLFHDHLARRGEGIASIATMFSEHADAAAVKAAFKEQFGLDTLCKAHIGDHIEYFYADTQQDFGCLIESGSGHAIDFAGPARVYPRGESKFGPSSVSGISYRISQVTLVVRDLDVKMANYHRAFGWGPWQVFDGDVFHDATIHDKAADFQVRFAQAQVADINFEIVQPLGGKSPWTDYLGRCGEGLFGMSVVADPPATVEDVVAQFSEAGVSVLARAGVGEAMWHLFDTQDTFKTSISVTSSHAYESATPVRAYPR